MQQTRIFALVFLASLLAACATPATPNYDAAFGESVRQAKALQTINPSAASNADPVAGIDGESGRAAVDLYQKSFVAPPKTFEVMNIGGGISGGQ